jgi:hypothetical protein
MPIYRVILVANTSGRFTNNGFAMKTRYTWGDTVRIKFTAPAHFRPSDLGEVCGMWMVETEENAAARNEPIGTITYTVEFGDGTSLQIPEQYLEDT